MTEPRESRALAVTAGRLRRAHAIFASGLFPFGVLIALSLISFFCRLWLVVKPLLASR